VEEATKRRGIRSQKKWRKQPKEVEEAKKRVSRNN
jgi:hypothetical protein